MIKKDGMIYRGWCRTNSFGEPITIVTKRTIEEDKKHYELYGKSDPIDGAFYDSTTTPALKNIFSRRFIKLLKQIDENYTPYWVALNTGLDRTTVIKIFSGEHLPSLSSFIRIYEWLTHYFPNLNMWYLLLVDAPMYLDDN